jgi:hypothetical protein
LDSGGERSVRSLALEHQVKPSTAANSKTRDCWEEVLVEQGLWEPSKAALATGQQADPVIHPVTSTTSLIPRGRTQDVPLPDERHLDKARTLRDRHVTVARRALALSEELVSSLGVFADDGSLEGLRDVVIARDRQGHEVRGPAGATQIKQALDCIRSAWGHMEAVSLEGLSHQENRQRGVSGHAGAVNDLPAGNTSGGGSGQDYRHHGFLSR